MTLACKILIGLGVWAAGLAIGAGGTYKYLKGQQARALLVQSESARETERLIFKGVQYAQNDRNRKETELTAAVDRATARLRDRKDRLPEPARAACQGSTGAELSRPDAEAFTQLGRDAEKVRLDLVLCEDRAWDLFNKLRAARPASE